MESTIKKTNNMQKEWNEELYDSIISPNGRNVVSNQKYQP
jgi:hypothetical protein